MCEICKGIYRSIVRDDEEEEEEGAATRRCHQLHASAAKGAAGSGCGATWLPKLPDPQVHVHITLPPHTTTTSSICHHYCTWLVAEPSWSLLSSSVSTTKRLAEWRVTTTTTTNANDITKKSAATSTPTIDHHHTHTTRCPQDETFSTHTTLTQHPAHRKCLRTSDRLATADDNTVFPTPGGPVITMGGSHGLTLPSSPAATRSCKYGRTHVDTTRHNKR